MSQFEQLYDGYRETNISGGDSWEYMKVFSPFIGIMPARSGVQIKTVLFVLSDALTDGQIEFSMWPNGLQSKTITPSDGKIVFWNLPAGVLTPNGKIHFKMVPSSDLAPQIGSITAKVLVDYDGEEEWCDLVCVYGTQILYKKKSYTAVPGFLGSYVAFVNSEVERVYVKRIGQAISGGSAEVSILVNGSEESSFTIDKSSSEEYAVDLSSSSVSLSPGDEVTMALSTDKKFRPQGSVKFDFGLEVRYL